MLQGLFKQGLFIIITLYKLKRFILMSSFFFVFDFVQLNIKMYIFIVLEQMNNIVLAQKNIFFT